MPRECLKKKKAPVLVIFLLACATLTGCNKKSASPATRPSRQAPTLLQSLYQRRRSVAAFPGLDSDMLQRIDQTISLLQDRDFQAQTP